MSAANQPIALASQHQRSSLLLYIILLLVSPQSPVLTKKNMAADTRDPDSSSSQPYPSTPATQDHNLKTYERFGTSPPSSYASNGGEVVEAARPLNANLLSGGTMNTAGGNIRETSILEAAKTIKLGDFKDLHKKPCVRDSFLVGIGAGFGVGGLRAVIGGWFSLLRSPFLHVSSSLLPPGLKSIYIYFC